MPFEMARARCLLAASYRANGDDASAALELQSARATFERSVPGVRSNGSTR